MQISYELTDEQLKRLRGIEKALYGDGSQLTSDKRRDLANALNVLLGQIEDQAVYPVIEE